MNLEKNLMFGELFKMNLMPAKIEKSFPPGNYRLDGFFRKMNYKKNLVNVGLY